MATRSPPPPSAPPGNGGVSLDLEMGFLAAQRAKTAHVAYLAFGLVMSWATGLLEQHPLVVGSLCLFLASVTVFRLARRSTTVARYLDHPRERALFRMGVVCSVLGYSLLVASALWFTGPGTTSLVFLIVLAGLASGAVATVASDRVLTRWVVAAALIPSIAVCLRPGGRVHWVVPLVLALSVVSYFNLARQLHATTREATMMRRRMAGRGRLLQEQGHQLLLQKRRAEAAAIAKSRFLATMSHELRTPMNAVVGTVDLLAETRLDSRQRDYVSTLTAAAQSLLQLINDILDFSKIEAQQVELEELAFRPMQLMVEVEQLLQHVERRSEVELQVRGDSDLPPAIVGDPVRLRQIMLNLGSNALKFTERGQVQVRLSLKNTRGQEAELRLEVQDTGCGMSESTVAHLFQEFRQADASTTRKHGGTGLGLAIAQRLASLMGGRIEVLSDVGRGSRFWLDLVFPIAEGAPRVLTGLPAPSARPRPTALHVLVVDDNAVNRKLATRMLEQLGCTHESAGDGKHAVEAVVDRHFDLILMDCMMPVMDGYTATRHLREEGVTTPIIAMTANARLEDKAECLHVGMNAHLAKPVRLRELEELLTDFRAVERENQPS